MNWDLNLATLLAIAIQVVFLVVFLVKTNSKAQQAYDLADAANKSADRAHQSIILTNTNMSLLREQVARDNPDHDALDAMEARLIAEIHRLSDRLDDVLNNRRRP